MPNSNKTWEWLTRKTSKKRKKNLEDKWRVKHYFNKIFQEAEVPNVGAKGTSLWDSAWFPILHSVLKLLPIDIKMIKE